MILKVVGVILVIISCGGMGFKIAANYRREENTLHQLVNILDYIECELKYRLTPLPDLCRKVAGEFNNIIGDVFSKLAVEMDKQISPDISHCLNAVLNATDSVPLIIKEELVLLGQNIGKFDLEGQLKSLEAVKQDCKRNLNSLSINRENRLRNYQTLGLCAGAALAILFI
jgi:stage III sporulation protein AB